MASLGASLVLVVAVYVLLVTAQDATLQCPRVDPSIFGVCAEMCSGDDSCETGMKCCSNGCGHSCMKPVSVPVVCAAIACDSTTQCEFGFETSSTGCPTCECKLSPCARTRCPAGTSCTLRKEQCTATSCDPVPVCEPTGVQQNCDNYKCPDNQRCQMLYPPCAAGSIVCSPVPTCVNCPALRCMECEFGNVIDRDGCRTCQCNNSSCDAKKCPTGTRCKLQQVQCFTTPCPTLAVCERCPPVPCKLGCPMRSGPDGCPVCSCQSAGCALMDCAPGMTCKEADGKAECVPVCRPVLCEMACPNGFANGSDGCPRCECAKGPSCDSMLCRQGYQCQEGDGEPKCVPETCPLVKCSNPCKYGFQRTDPGCQTCDCINNPCDDHQCGPNQKCQLESVFCFTTPCQPVPVCKDVCRPLTCRLSCVTGYQKDANGCDVCACADPCALVDCRPGYECQVQGTQATCARRCRPLFCFRRCEFGYAVNRNGCKTCRCNPDPCTRNNCGPNEECVLEKVTCMTEPCYPVPRCQEVQDQDVCPPLPCRCQFGHAVDANGCMTCTCLQNPCESKRCPRLCLPLAFPCENKPCPMVAVCASDWAEWIGRLFRRF